MTSRSSVCSTSLRAGALGAWLLACAAGARPPAADAVGDPGAAPPSSDWKLEWTRIEPGEPVRTYLLDASGEVRRIVNARAMNARDTLARALVRWAAEDLRRARVCALPGGPADARLEVSLSDEGSSCRVVRSVAAWRRDADGRRVLAVVDSLERVVCRDDRCSPFDR